MVAKYPSMWYYSVRGMIYLSMLTYVTISTFPKNLLLVNNHLEMDGGSCTSQDRLDYAATGMNPQVSVVRTAKFHLCYMFITCRCRVLLHSIFTQRPRLITVAGGRESLNNHNS